MSHFGDLEHHFQVSIGDDINYIPNTWVMFNVDIYQPLLKAWAVSFAVSFHLGFPTRSQLHRRINHLPHAIPSWISTESDTLYENLAEA